MEWDQFPFFCLPTGKALKDEVKIKGSKVGFEKGIHQTVSEGIAKLLPDFIMYLAFANGEFSHNPLTLISHNSFCWASD